MSGSNDAPGSANAQPGAQWPEDAREVVYAAQDEWWRTLSRTQSFVEANTAMNTVLARAYASTAHSSTVEPPAHNREVAGSNPAGQTEWPDEAAVTRAWNDLLNKDDRTSPEEYPEMCLITRDEVAALLAAGRQPTYQDGLNRAWRVVDALGGTWPKANTDEEVGYQSGYDAALENGCKAIEALGGKDPDGWDSPAQLAPPILSPPKVKRLVTKEEVERFVELAKYTPHDWSKNQGKVWPMTEEGLQFALESFVNGGEE